MVKRNSFDRDGRSNKRRKSNDGRRIERNSNEGCSVFVGNLRYETRWQALKDHMRKAGNVDSANILEAPNGRSKGCALITYQHPKEASRAIKELNETELEGRKIFVQPDTKVNDEGRRVEPSTANGVYVGNLPYECSWQALKDFFKTCGYIERAEVMEDPQTGRKKGFGLVYFSNERGVENAIRKFHGTDFQGRTLEVRPDKKSGGNNNNSNAPSSSRNNNNNNDGSGDFKVFFGNLDFNCSWQDLKDFVQKRCGRVEHADIPKKGWGVVSFANRRDAGNAISQLDRVVFQNRTLEVRWDRDSGNGSSSAPNNNSNNNSNNSNKQLYVGNLPYECTWQNLKDAFKRFGPVGHAEVCETANGRTTGFGIIAFVKPSSAEQALKSMDGADFEGRKISVRWDRRPGKLESDKAGKQRSNENNGYKPKPKPKPAEPMQEEPTPEEPKGDPLDMALSARR
eukprot:CAMPEP_0116130994 /NCGR_PEP_ID=MMETSP0329-20121206/8774_1 /TAXON_ID=697910 /ORGANISM="Pseudo-nitzschia arenysensis, Strain B593" /LENGTH=454 /DNA_ID=CAMNT_0003625405 /DNA_START=56 /DNA_END=1420 /DNA_ORIENTATION=-